MQKTWSIMQTQRTYEATHFLASLILATMNP